MYYKRILPFFLFCILLSDTLPLFGSDQRKELTTMFSLLLFAKIDCYGTTGGTAYVDICGICAGGNTGKSPCTVVKSAEQTWIDRNLGASRMATTFNDPEAFGDLYQWGRLKDGHQNRSSSTSSVRSDTNTPQHSSFIIAAESPYDWRSSPNNDLWQGVSGVNNPCPPGFRIPNNIEFETERNSWNSDDAAGAFGSQLKLVMAGIRYFMDGVIYSTDTDGIYWSSTVFGVNSYYLGFSANHSGVTFDYRANGYSVRCIQD